MAHVDVIGDSYYDEEIVDGDDTAEASAHTRVLQAKSKKKSKSSALSDELPDEMPIVSAASLKKDKKKIKNAIARFEADKALHKISKVAASSKKSSRIHQAAKNATTVQKIQHQVAKKVLHGNFTVSDILHHGGGTQHKVITRQTDKYLQRKKYEEEHYE